MGVRGGGGKKWGGGGGGEGSPAQNRKGVGSKFGISMNYELSTTQSFFPYHIILDNSCINHYFVKSRLSEIRQSEDQSWQTLFRPVKPTNPTV